MTVSHWKKLAFAACLSLAALPPAGCIQPARSTDQLAEFEQATSLQIVVDMDSLRKGSISCDPYKVVSDDVLEIYMPLVLADAAEMDRDKAKPVLCRVGADGAVGLPIAGRLQVAGKTFAQIEREVIGAYYPRYVKRAPAVMVRVSDPHTEKVRVLGAVKEPGIHALRSDEMTLVSAIMKAGGILPEGAASIRIKYPGQKDKEVLLPVKGLNIPFSDVELTGGTEIEIARANPRLITVLGLVKKPGVFTTEPDATYNLAQALALAGGVDHMANPRYAKVCRQDRSGKLLTRPVRIDDQNLSSTPSVPVRTGDIVVVENTLDTDVRMILLQALRVAVSATYSVH